MFFLVQFSRPNEIPADKKRWGTRPFLKFTDHLRVKVQHQAAVDEVLRISRCDMAASNDPGTMSKWCVSLFGSFVFRLKVMESEWIWPFLGLMKPIVWQKFSMVRDSSWSKLPGWTLRDTDCFLGAFGERYTFFVALGLGPSVILGQGCIGG